MGGCLPAPAWPCGVGTAVPNADGLLLLQQPCEDAAEVRHSCDETGDGAVRREAEAMCQKLLANPFSQCHSEVRSRGYHVWQAWLVAPCPLRCARLTDSASALAGGPRWLLRCLCVRVLPGAGGWGCAAWCRLRDLRQLHPGLCPAPYLRGLEAAWFLR